MTNTDSPGDRSTEPESQYGTCTREAWYGPECRECNDTGTLGPNKALSQDYCDCAFGRYLQRTENEED